MDLQSIFKLTGWITDGLTKLGMGIYQGAKKGNLLLQNYEEDALYTRSEKAYDPKSEKYWLKDYKFYQKMSPEGKKRLDAVIDFVFSPNFGRILAVACIGLLFFSPLGPIVAGVAAACTLGVIVGGFCYESFKIKRNNINKEAHRLLGDMAERLTQLAPDLKSFPELKEFYKNKVLGLVTAEDKIIDLNKAAFRNGTVAMGQSLAVLTAAILSFNIPAFVIGGVGVVTTAADLGMKLNSEAKAIDLMHKEMRENAQKLGVGFKCNGKSLAKLQDMEIKQHAFEWACKNTQDKNNMTDFQKNYKQAYKFYKATTPKPKFTFKNAMKENITKGFSYHKALEINSPVAKSKSVLSKEIREKEKLMKPVNTPTPTVQEKPQVSFVEKTSPNKNPKDKNTKKSFTEDIKQEKQNREKHRITKGDGGMQRD